MDLTLMPEDLTQEEKEMLKDYKKAGCPGLVKINATSVSQWFDLYMGGKTYTEISQITHSKKDLILYIAEKGRWHDKRFGKYQDIADGLLEKTKNSILESADNITSMIAAFNRYYTNKFNKYLANNDDSIIETLDTKLLSQYSKALESLDKLMTTAKGGKGGGSPDGHSSKRPEINININSPAETEIIDTIDTVDLSKARNSGEALKALLRMKKDKKKK